MGKRRKFFGPSKDDVWREISEKLGAEFVDRGKLKGSVLRFHHGEWVITLDTYAVMVGSVYITYTRLRAPYVNQDGFRFKVYNENFFSKIGKKFGMQDVVVGYPEFDDQFIIQGNNEDRLRELFANDRVRGLLTGKLNVQFMVKDDEGYFGAEFPEGVDELYLIKQGISTDIEEIRRYYDLFSEVLDWLCFIGAAYEDDPGVSL